MSEEVEVKKQQQVTVKDKQEYIEAFTTFSADGKQQTAQKAKNPNFGKDVTRTKTIEVGKRVTTKPWPTCGYEGSE